MTVRQWWAGSALRAVGAIGVVACLTAGCGSSGVELPERVDQPPPATPSGPTVDPEHAPILAAYEAYIAAYDEASRLGDPDYPELREHAEGAAYESARGFVDGYLSSGWRFTGARTVVWAHVTGVGPGSDSTGAPDLGDVPEGVPVSPLATVSACLDVSEYLPVDADDGSLIVTERDVEVHEAEAILRYDDDQDRWLVVDASLDWEKPC